MLFPPGLSALTLLALTLPFDDPQPAALCDGCVGTAFSAVASGGGCSGASVSVSVTMISGACAWVYDSPTSGAECREQRGCEVTIERSWSNLPANSPIDICITLEAGGPTLCLGKPPPTSGSGSGSDIRTGPSLDCSGGSRSFSLTSSACGLSATGTATCSACAGDN
jgi:hypothetical protein